MFTKLAPFRPAYEGAPHINAPSVFGASPGRPFLFLIPTVGERPMRFSASGLPEGLVLDTVCGKITGTAPAQADYSVTLTAENALGSDSKTITLRIQPDGLLRTPLMGWTSWNAYRNKMTQVDIARAARQLLESGLTAYGYSYVNIDSGWQGVYGGEHGAIQPNNRFPEMRTLADAVHEMGLKLGIYSTPMQRAWGGGEYPGCTRGRLDRAFPDAFFGIGVLHCEAENVRQWEDWNIDYLKYDWSPCDIKNAELMKEQLRASKRDFGFCVTVRAGIGNADYWQANCSSWRDNSDSRDEWKNVLTRFNTDHWAKYCVPGHFFDLDMLELGCMDSAPCRLTEDEQLVAYTIRVIFPSPLQISAQLDRLTDFDLAVLGNDEVIAVNQDSLGVGAVCVSEKITHNLDRGIEQHIKIYVKPLEDGSYAVGFFNLGETTAEAQLPLDKPCRVRDLWARESLPDAEGEISAELAPHTVRLLKIKAII